MYRPPKPTIKKLKWQRNTKKMANIDGHINAVRASLEEDDT